MESMKLALRHQVPIPKIALQSSSKKGFFLRSFETFASDVIAKDALVESVTTFLADGPKEAADCFLLHLHFLMHAD